MSWLLTDKEMEGLLGLELKTAYSGHIKEYRVLIKAQAKKLIIAISENSHMGDKYLHVNPQWWQALKKDLGKRLTNYTE